MSSEAVQICQHMHAHSHPSPSRRISSPPRRPATRTTLPWEGAQRGEGVGLRHACGWVDLLGARAKGKRVVPVEVLGGEYPGAVGGGWWLRSFPPFSLTAGLVGKGMASLGTLGRVRTGAFRPSLHQQQRWRCLRDLVAPLSMHSSLCTSTPRTAAMTR